MVNEYKIKKNMDFRFPLLLHVVFFFFRFFSLSVLNSRGKVGFWSKWVGGGTATTSWVLKFLISSGGVLDNACQELAMNGRIVTDTQQVRMDEWAMGDVF